jgi:hypothetical protein
MLNGAAAVALIFGVDYVGRDNIRQRAKEIVDLIYELRCEYEHYFFRSSNLLL